MGQAPSTVAQLGMLALVVLAEITYKFLRERWRGPVPGDGTSASVPGVITVTPHARYYSSHGLVADEVARRELPVEQTQALLRRCEMMLAAVDSARGHLLRQGVRATWTHHAGATNPVG